MSDALVTLERSNAIVTITINNPPVNAVSSRVLNAVIEAFDAAERDPEARCIIFTGAGNKAFSAGGDLREEKDFGSAEASRAFRALGRKTLNRIEACKLPVISAIHGYCIGGGTALAWVCDIRLAADNTVFRAADAHLGMLPSWGMGLTRLPRFVGRNHALDILLTGYDFDAQRAYELGLVGDFQHAVCRHRDEHGIDVAIDIVQAGVRLATEQLGLVGVDQVDLAFETDMFKRFPGIEARPDRVGRADDGNAARTQQTISFHAGS